MLKTIKTIKLGVEAKAGREQAADCLDKSAALGGQVLVAFSLEYSRLGNLWPISHYLGQLRHVTQSVCISIYWAGLLNYLFNFPAHRFLMCPSSLDLGTNKPISSVFAKSIQAYKMLRDLSDGQGCKVLFHRSLISSLGGQGRKVVRCYSIPINSCLLTIGILSIPAGVHQRTAGVVCAWEQGKETVEKHKLCL